jgi:hypothetical protein
VSGWFAGGVAAIPILHGTGTDIVPHVLDPAVSDAVARHGSPALAWEVLRRDPAYQAAAAARRAIAGDDLTADSVFAAHWGLHFR